jgi:hypothetical protein
MWVELEGPQGVCWWSQRRKASGMSGAARSTVEPEPQGVCWSWSRKKHGGAGTARRLLELEPHICVGSVPRCFLASGHNSYNCTVMR